MNKAYLSQASSSYTAPQSQISSPLKYELWKEIFIIRVGGSVISLCAPTPEEDPPFSLSRLNDYTRISNTSHSREYMMLSYLKMFHVKLRATINY
jgi:hypothetical protein